MVNKDKILFYQNILNGDYRLIKYTQEGALDNSKEKTKRVLEEICNDFGGKKCESETYFGVNLTFKRKWIPIIKSEVVMALEDHYERDVIIGTDARIYITRKLFSPAKKEILTKIQDSLKKNYEVQIKQYS